MLLQIPLSAAKSWCSNLLTSLRNSPLQFCCLSMSLCNLRASVLLFHLCVSLQPRKLNLSLIWSNAINHILAHLQYCQLFLIKQLKTDSHLLGWNFHLCSIHQTSYSFYLIFIIIFFKSLWLTYLQLHQLVGETGLHHKFYL